MLEDKVKEWGKAKGINVTVVMINQNETTQKVSAAIEAGNMPDALDMGRDLMLLLSKNNRLEGLDDIYKKIGDAHGGWMDSTNRATDPKDFGGKIYVVPGGQIPAHETIMGRTTALQCCGGEHGMFICHGNGWLFVQSGNFGVGELWFIIPTINLFFFTIRWLGS